MQTAIILQRAHFPKKFWGPLAAKLLIRSKKARDLRKW